MTTTRSMPVEHSLESTVNFAGRILFLSQDASLIARQLAGEDIATEAALPLRNDVSTDEISPTWVTYHYDEKLGDYPYAGLRCGDVAPFATGSVKAGGFAVTVAGRRYGKGSSREASPFAEWCAGIQLVIAESFERTYRQNCRNLGIFTSTDFGLIERIRNGESIPVEEFTRGEDELTAELIRRGGLFALMRARQQGWSPSTSVAPTASPAGPMTYAEKIIARAAGRASVKAGDGVFVRADWRYAHEYNSPLGIAALERAMGSDVQLADVASIICFSDHLPFIHQVMPEARRKLGLLDLAQMLGKVQQRFCEHHGIRLHGFLKDRDGCEGISHSIMTERYVLPGQLAVGTDSHTPHCGALGTLAFGIGSTEMACAWLTGEVRMQVPKTCRVQLHGSLKPGVEAKDIVLHILRLPYVREGHAIGQIFEYSGSGLTALSTDERATLTNMVAEIGGFTGIVVPDAETRRFLQQRRNVDFAPEAWMGSDADAEVANVIDIDCSAITPMLAQPGDPGLGIATDQLVQPVRVDIAYSGSCTGGKLDDVMRVHEVLHWADTRGLRVATGTRFILQFGSQEVREHCVRAEMMPLFERIGAELVEPGCGACVNAGPGVSDSTSQVTVSSINRNFPGRSGPGQVWLASPSTVAASAIAGHIVSFEQLQDSVSEPAHTRSR